MGEKVWQHSQGWWRVAALDSVWPLLTRHQTIWGMGLLRGWLSVVFAVYVCDVEAVAPDLDLGPSQKCFVPLR